ncbi:MAG: hypothetical protein AB8B97_03190 [Granulosicoccus sp.]
MINGEHRTPDSTPAHGSNQVAGRAPISRHVSNGTDVNQVQRRQDGPDYSTGWSPKSIHERSVTCGNQAKELTNELDKLLNHVEQMEPDSANDKTKDEFKEKVRNLIETIISNNIVGLNSTEHAYVKETQSKIVSEGTNLAIKLIDDIRICVHTSEVKFTLPKEVDEVYSLFIEFRQEINEAERTFRTSMETSTNNSNNSNTAPLDAFITSISQAMLNYQQDLQILEWNSQNPQSQYV